MSTYKKKPLNRRTFLRGAGVAIALPFLEAMLPWRGAFADQMDMPRRMIAYYIPNGIHMQKWTPSGSGSNFQLTEILQPLANVKDDLMVLTGIENRPARPDGPGDHASGTGAFITAAHPKKTEGSDIQNGISVDQYAVNELNLKEKTRITSLQLGMDGGGSTGGCDSGYSCAYARNISWAGPQTPLPKISDVRQAFNFIFGGFDPNEAQEAAVKRRAYQKSILDYVKRDTKQLQQGLGTRDRQKLEEYLDGLRALEIKVDMDMNGPGCMRPDPTMGPTNYAGKAQAMADLMIAAFECDLTRVITFMLANAGSGRNYQSEPGVMVSGNHHQISHHESKQENYDKLTAINIWEVRQLAYLLEGLKAKRDIDGKTLLENSMVFFSSEISDGNRHNHDNMPIILAGNAGGAFTPGRHVTYDGKPPVANLFVSMLQAMGVQTTSFGMDSTGAINKLKM